jgi:hypothetical protein
MVFTHGVRKHVTQKDILLTCYPIAGKSKAKLLVNTYSHGYCSIADTYLVEGTVIVVCIQVATEFLSRLIKGIKVKYRKLEILPIVFSHNLCRG